ncbi:unnamed protein product [Pylaiella littoralis]
MAESTPPLLSSKGMRAMRWPRHWYVIIFATVGRGRGFFPAVSRCGRAFPRAGSFLACTCCGANGFGRARQDRTSGLGDHTLCLCHLPVCSPCSSKLNGLDLFVKRVCPRYFLHTSCRGWMPSAHRCLSCIRCRGTDRQFGSVYIITHPLRTPGTR